MNAPAMQRTVNGTSIGCPVAIVVVGLTFSGDGEGVYAGVNNNLGEHERCFTAIMTHNAVASSNNA